MRTILSAAAAWLVLSVAGPACASDSVATLIGGNIVTPHGVILNGWLKIKDGMIVWIGAQKPALESATELDTNDFVYPGFVDLHNHLTYGVFPRWATSADWQDRYAWRKNELYNAAITAPNNALITAHEFCDMDEFAEVKQLIGGTTSVIGVFPPKDEPANCILGLARNLDEATGFYKPAIGHERIRNELGVKEPTFDPKAVRAAIQNNSIDLVVIHIAEGQRNDPESLSEFGLLKSDGLLTAHSAIVHGVALTSNDFAEMHAAGASLVWSPRSNFVLYGQTADVASAVANGVTISLAPDWSPTGSTNMLAELRYASDFNHNRLNSLFTDRQLFEMTSSVPAKVAHIDDRVGSLAAGHYADLFLVHSDRQDPYAALIQAQPDDTTLVLVGGVPIYGTHGNLAALGIANMEKIQVCGAEGWLNSAALPNGPLAQVQTRLEGVLKANHSELAPIVECY